MGLLYEHHRITRKGREAEKRDDSQQEQINAIKQEQMRQSHASQEELHNLAEHQARMQALEQETVHTRQAVEQIPSLVAKAETKSRPTIEERPEQVTNEPERKPAQLPTIGDLIAERNPLGKDKPEVVAKSPNVTHIDPKEVLKPSLQEKDSEILLRHVEAAAETGVALEGQYELRHEVKDVATALGDNLGGGIGGVSAPSQTGSVDTSQLFKADVSPGTVQQSLQDQSSDAYKQAVWAGLWGAAIVLVALAIWTIST
jgi:hypothetical protein